MWIIATFGILCIIIASIYLLVMFVFNSYGPIIQRADAFAGYLLKNDSNNAYAISSKGLKTGISEQQLKQYFAKLNDALSGGKLNRIDKHKNHNDKVKYATVLYEISKGSKKFYLLVTLINEDDVWKIHNFETNQKKPVTTRP
jgi:hypothetical protein